ncbi:Nepenthesin [Bertholletia excelsa]
MAASLLFLKFSLIFFVIAFSSAVQRPWSHNCMILRVTKDLSTLQYLTRLYLGSARSEPVKVVLDLGGPLLWLSYCPSFRPLPCKSLQCSRAIANSSCFSDTCNLRAVNAVTGAESPGELAEDVVAIDATSYSITAIERFLFSCAPPWLMTGLASQAQGMMGLGMGRIGLPSQLAAVGHFRNFALCLSPSSGSAIFAGDRREISLSGDPVWNSLTYTPLVPNPDGEYYVKIKSIKVNRRRLSLDLSSDLIVKLSTIVPYSTMESSIYKTLVRAYTQAAAAANITQVGAVHPFELCFSSGGEFETPVVPEIEFVLQSEMVKWGIFGRNAMVEVSEGVMCLGILDGGVNNGFSVVLGGQQLEDNLLEFDLGTAMLGFSSLLKMNTSCSDFRLGFIAGDESV